MSHEGKEENRPKKLTALFLRSAPLREKIQDGTSERHTCSPLASYTDLPDAESCDREGETLTLSPQDSATNSPIIGRPAQNEDGCSWCF